MKNLPHILLVLTLQGFSFLGPHAYGQNPIPPVDTIRNGNAGVIVSDTLAAADTLKVQQKGDVETTIVYSADDSIRMDIVNKLVYLYGNAKINYGNIYLSAAEMEINWSTNIITARGTTDSLGKDVGVPVFKEGEDTYVTNKEGMKYNFKTKKGIIYGVVTQQGEGYIHGERVKKVEEHLYISSAQYTTCNLSHPHFYINAKKLKVIPENKVISGPFNLVISDVPTPLGFFLGFFPIPKKEKSGIIFPTAGSSDRGFFLRDGGYYWAVNDYIGVKLTGDAYANGSWRGTFAGDYIKRYAYSGKLDLSYSKTKRGFDENEGFGSDIHVGWHHRTQTKKNSSLSADVNANSSSFYKRNTLNPIALQTGVFSSTILYYKNFANTPFNLNIALRQDQNVVTRVMNFTLPEATFAMNRIYPFKRKAGGGQNWYEKINVGYTGNTKLFITNDSIRTELDTVLPFSPKNIPTLLAKAEYGARHTIPISATFKVNKTFLRYFNFTPNFNYEEFWYPKKLNYKWDTDSNSLITTTEKGFFRTTSYSTSMNMSTTIYGKYKFNSKKLLGMMHVIIPTIGYSYRPDFAKQGTSFQNVQVNQSGRFENRSHYAGFIYGAPSGGGGVTNSLTFNILNTFEAKVASKKDTVTGIRKFKLIDQLSINGSYNFTAVQNKLSLINVVGRTRLFDRFDINSSATFDPYIFVVDTTEEINRTIRSNKLAITEGEGLAKLRNYNLSIGANLNPKARSNYRSNKGSEAELRQINASPELYVDFNIPWTLFVSYNVNYNNPVISASLLTQSLTFNGDIKLTEKWKIGFTSGYDVVFGKLTTTSINVHRDLHCWQMSFNVVPFGSIQSYSFTINAKSSILQDLKLNKKSPGYFGGGYY